MNRTPWTDDWSPVNCAILRAAEIMAATENVLREHDRVKIEPFVPEDFWIHAQNLAHLGLLATERLSTLDGLSYEVAGFVARFRAEFDPDRIEHHVNEER